MAKKVTLVDRRKFVHGISLASAGDRVASPAAAGLEQPVSTWAGAILHADEGQRIPDTPDGRRVTINVDSQLTSGVRMSMIAEDLLPDSEIRAHLHHHEDEIIFIRMEHGIATRWYNAFCVKRWEPGILSVTTTQRGYHDDSRRRAYCVVGE